MALVIDKTIGGSNSNSYVDETEADTYFEGRLNADSWTGATAGSGGNKDKALVNAARRLDQERFDGVRANIGVQKLKHPRTGLLDSDDVTVSSAIIHPRIKDAQCELALFFLTGDQQGDDALKDFEKLKVGPIDITPRAGVKNKLPEEVSRLISIFQRETSQWRLSRS